MLRQFALQSRTTRGQMQMVARRTFANYSQHGSDPLHLLQQECHARGLCNEIGQRLPETDWRIVIAMGSDGRVPNVRTVNIERVSTEGIDFVLKRSSFAAQAMGDDNIGVSFLHSQGKFLTGQSAEQWRGEGSCVELELDQVLDQIPPFTVTSIVGSTRLVQEQKESDNNKPQAEVSADRSAVGGNTKSHVLEIMQTTRQELEQGKISRQELEACIRPFRLQPDRVECMIASPDNHVMWDRWEWLRQKNGGSWEEAEWANPVLLVPH